MTPAGCISVRPSSGASPSRSASASSAVISACRSVSTSASARRVASTIALSITSWLVLPQWTHCAAPASACATACVSCPTSGIARLPARPAACTRAGMSMHSARQAAAMAAAAAAGITPSSASAWASAASKSSIAWTIAGSPKVASMAGVDRKPSKALLATTGYAVTRRATRRSTSARIRPSEICCAWISDSTPLRCRS